MENVSVKIPREKSKFVRLLKAEAIRAGNYGATDAEVIGEALEFAFERKGEFAAPPRKGSVDAVLAFAGSWKMSDAEAELLKKNVREWRWSRRTFA